MTIYFSLVLEIKKEKYQMLSTEDNNRRQWCGKFWSKHGVNRKFLGIN